MSQVGSWHPPPPQPFLNHPRQSTYVWSPWPIPTLKYNGREEHFLKGTVSWDCFLILSYLERWFSIKNIFDFGRKKKFFSRYVHLMSIVVFSLQTVNMYSGCLLLVCVYSLSALSINEGQCHEIFFMNLCPPAPEYPIRAVSNIRVNMITDV